MDNDKTNLRANACVPMVEKMQGRYMLRKPLFAFTMWLFDTFCGLILPPSHPEIPETPRRILICNGAHLGDVVMTLPAFKAVRDAFPRSEIGLLIGSWSVPIVQNTGLYNNLHILDSVRHNRGKNAVMRIAQFVRQSVAVIKEIKAKNYDVAIDIYPHFPNSIFTIYAARIPIRCGFTSGGGGAFLTHQVRWQYEGKPMGRCGRNLFTALWPNSAIAQNPLEPCYPGQPRAPLPPTLFTKKYIAIHTGTGAAHKEWPEAHWTRLIDDLLQSGFHIAMLGAGDRCIQLWRAASAGLSALGVHGLALALSGPVW